MKIGIIGAGQIGGTLTRRFRTLGHEVFVANSRGPETLSDLAAETGATAVSVPEAVRGVDVVCAHGQMGPATGRKDRSACTKRAEQTLAIGTSATFASLATLSAVPSRRKCCWPDPTWPQFKIALGVHGFRPSSKEFPRWPVRPDRQEWVLDTQFMLQTPANERMIMARSWTWAVEAA
jgi:hypothetical protein